MHSLYSTRFWGVKVASSAIRQLLLAWLCLNALLGNALAIEFSTAEKQFIADHPEISVGIDGAWPPLDFIDAAQKHRGISADYIELISTTTGIRMAPNRGNSWDDMLNRARAREIDVVASLAKSTERKQHWRYSAPYFQSPYAIATRKQVHGLGDLASLAGKTVAIEQGYYLQHELAAKHPQIKLKTFADTGSALKAVSREQADAYIGNQAVIFYLIEQLRLTNLRVAADAGFPPGKLHFGVRSDWPELVSIIDKVLTQIPRLRRLEIERHWLGVSPRDLSTPSTVSRMTLTGEEQLWLQQHPRLRVGVMSDWPPISHRDASGEAVGIDSDIVRQLNQRLGERLQIVSAPWAEIYQDIQQKQLDLIMGATPRDYRLELMDFSSPYLSVPHIIVARKGESARYTDESMLSGKTVALETDFVNVNYFRQQYPEVSIKTYPNTLAALEAVSAGDADAYAGSRVVALYLIEQHLLSNLKVHGRLSKAPTELAVAIRKDMPLLSSIIQKALDDIHPSGIRQIVNHWVALNNAAGFEYRIDLSNEERQWLKQHPQLAIGVMRNWPPFNFIAAEGAASGIGADLIHEIEQRLGIELDIVSADWKQIYEDVAERRLDLIMDITPKPSREPLFNFTEPYLDIPHVIIAKHDSGPFRSEQDLIGKTIALEEGFGNVKYFRTGYPEINLKLYPDTAQALEAVAQGEADAYAGNRVVSLHLIEKRGLPTLKVHGPINKPGSILAIGARKDYPIAATIMQKALDSIGERRIQEIKNQWIYDSFSRDPQLILLNDEEKQWLEQHPVIPIGVDGNWPPLDFFDEQQQHAGITAEYLRLIGERLGVRFTPQPADSFKAMLEQLIRGELGVGASVSFNPERAQALWFTRSFFEVRKVIITRSDVDDIRHIEDLYGKTVAIEGGFLSARQLQQKHPAIQQLPQTSTSAALEKVSWGQADAYIGNQAVAGWITRQQQLTNLTVVGDAALGSAPLNFAVSKNAPSWQPLAGIIDKALASISLEDRIRIENRWLGRLEDDTQQPAAQLKLSNEQRNWLAQHKQIRIGVDANWQPLEFIDEQGRYQGLSAEFMQHFSRQIGVEIVPPEVMPWSDVLNRLRDKSLDLAPMLIETPQRREYLNFTKPYASFPVVIFNRRGTTLLNGLGDLSGYKAAIVEGYAINELIARDYPLIERVNVASTEAGLEALLTGQVDAQIDVLAVGAYLIESKGMSNLQVAAATPYQHEFAIGVRKDWPQLVAILNQAIDHMSPVTSNEFLKKWLTVNFQKHIDYTLLYWVIGIALAVFTLLTLRARMMARVNAQLQEGRNKLNLSLESAELGTFEISFPRGETAQFNWDKTCAQHHDFPEDPQLREVADFLKYIEPEFALPIRTQLAAYIKGESDKFRVEYRTSRNHRWILAHGRVFERDPDGWAQRMVGISQDITERKEAHLAMQRSNQFKSQFLANMSHEIRTPMNAIVGLAYLLFRSGLDDKQADYVKNLQKSARILLNLIDDILDFSKIEAGHLHIEKTEFNLESLLSDLADLTNIRIHQSDVEFILDMGTNIPKMLIGDPFRLNQVLNNLVSNAVKFTESGSIVLKVNFEQRADERVWLKFSVNDTGIGIAADKLESLFAPFIQEDGSTTRKHGGTGLGLSISKQLTELMGGDLHAQSEKGRGSSFYFRLPFDLPQDGKELSLLTPPQPDLRGLRVLLVDDNPVSLKILDDTLKSLSFKVDSASSGQQALQQLHQAKKVYDLILLDWRMPSMDGLATAQHIRQEIDQDKMPLIILMTAYGRDVVEQDVSKAQLDGILIKPITASSLFNAIIQARSDKSSSPQARVKEPQPEAIEQLEGHILLAEDNPINQKVAQEILLQMGVEVTVCENGHEVLDALKHKTPNLILMDIQMPKLDGYQTAGKIRQKPKFDQMPIVAMTANAMKEDVAKSRKAGMQAHISKPVDPEVLYRTLREYLPLKPSKSATESGENIDHHDQTTRHWPEAVDGLNIAQGIKQVGGNEALYQRLLGDFIVNNHQIGIDMRQLISAGDIQSAARLAHTIKGVAANIGANRLHLAAAEIDRSFKLKHTVAEAQLEEITRAGDELNRSIAALKDKGAGTQDTTQTARLIHGDKLIFLHALLSAADSGSRHLFESLAPAIADQQGQAKVDELGKLISDYEFERAAAFLAQLYPEWRSDNG